MFLGNSGESMRLDAVGTYLPRPRMNDRQHMLYFTVSGRCATSASEGGRPMVPARPPETIPPVAPQASRRIQARRLILAGLALLILLAGFEIGIRQVSPDAVQASAYTVDGGPPFATRHITDARSVADLYTRINNLPTVWYSAIDRCPTPQSNTVYYHVYFTRSGVLIEAAALVEKGCSVWDVVRGGIPVAHNDPDGQTQVILSEALLP